MVLPVVLTVAVMPLSYSIANGIGVGFITWVVLRAAAGRAREISPLLWIVAAGFALYFARGLQRPWVEEDNWYGAVYSQAAHNNLRAGLKAGGVPATLYFGPLPIPSQAYYVHHPTLLPVMVTASFAVFGEAEWTARLPQRK